MQKIITLLLTLAIMTPVSFANAADTLSQYYYELGKKLPTISERAVTYAEIASDFYSGTYEQNVKLLDYLQDNKLGFSPTTNFAKRLSSSISATDTEIPITSILDDDGTALSCSATNKCYFNIEQGTSKEERVVCSATTTTSVASCVRGLAATGNSEVGDSDRAYPHNAGSRIIMTNIAQFYGNYINLWDAQTKAGVLTFSDSPIVPSPTTATQAATKGYVDGVAIQGGATSTESVVGLSQLATQAEMAATDFDANNPQVISTKYSTSSPDVVGSYAIISEADGNLDQDWLDKTEKLNWTGDTTFASTTITGTTTLNNTSVIYPIASSSVASKGYVDSNLIYGIEASASSNLRVNDSTEESESGSSYSKIKEIQVLVGGVVNTAFDLKRDGASGVAYGRIYLNGVAIGAERSTESTSYITYNEDVDVGSGDYIQIYAKASGATTDIRNFKLSFDVENTTSWAIIK